MAIDPEDIHQIAVLAAEKVLADAVIAKALKGEKTTTDNRVNMLQYINTFILSVIAVIAVLIFTTTSKVRDAQTSAASELIRMKTVQDINVANIDQVDKRLTAVEQNQLEYIKTWVEDNFLRKPQK
jgi:Sec-independent protein translocase protein TatA